MTAGASSIAKVSAEGAGGVGSFFEPLEVIPLKHPDSSPFASFLTSPFAFLAMASNGKHEDAPEEGLMDGDPKAARPRSAAVEVNLTLVSKIFCSFATLTAASMCPQVPSSKNTLQLQPLRPPS